MQVTRNQITVQKKLKTKKTSKKSQKQKNVYQKNNKMKKSPKKEVKDLKTNKEYHDVTKNNQLSIAEHCNVQYENEETSQNKDKEAQKPVDKLNEEAYNPMGSCVLLPQVEKVLANNPDLRGTFTRLADEMSASLEKTSLRLEETEKKLAEVYPEVKEWWEDAGNSTCEANQAILEDTILDSNTYEMADQDEEIVTQDECFSTIRMDWCSQHNIARQLCYVMPEPCNANTEDEEMIQYENEGRNNDEEKDKKWVTKMD